MKKTIMVVTTLALSVIVGCGTWHGLGKDIGRTGDAMAGKGKYVITVQASPDRATAAARRAVEQLKMTNIESSFDEGEGEGEVTAKTARGEKVSIDIEQSGATHSKVTIRTRGDNSDEVSKQIQDRIRGNL